MAAAWSKLEEYAARLALVIHFTRWAANDPNLAHSDTVDAASMNAGITLARWFKHEALRVYAMLDKSDAERDERRLLDWIGRKGGSVTAREVQQGCRWLKDPGAAETALDELAKTSRGAWQDLPPTAKGGRPARVFAVYAASRLRNPSETRRNEGSVDVDGVDAFENADENATGLIECGTGSGPYQVGF